MKIESTYLILHNIVGAAEGSTALLENFADSIELTSLRIKHDKLERSTLHLFDNSIVG
jgi:hypothetical protein